MFDDLKDCEPDKLVAASEQPFGIEIHIADDVFVKQMAVPRAHTIVPQHAHRYDHLSMLAKGSVRVWKNDDLDGDYVAPTGIYIVAGVKHRFETLEDDTVIYCIHNAARPEVAEVVEDHQIVEVN